MRWPQVAKSVGILACNLCIATQLLSAQQHTAHDIVASVAEALGGADRIDALRTFRFEVHHWRDGSEWFTGVWEIQRPNLIRKEYSSTVIFDGIRASIDSGSPGGPELVDADEWFHFPFDIACVFPAFFDHDSEYLGQHTVEGVDGHLLRVKLPLGGAVTYFIDAEYHLPRRLAITLDVGDTESEMTLSWGLEDFREVDGVLFPHAYSYDGNHVRALQTVEFNVPFPDDHFKVAIGND